MKCTSKIFDFIFRIFEKNQNFEDIQKLAMIQNSQKKKKKINKLILFSKKSKLRGLIKNSLERK